MPTVERTITAPQSPEKVWDYLVDFTRAREWDPATLSAERTAGDGAVGTTYRTASTLLGEEQTVDYVVTDCVHGSLLQLAGDAGSVHLLESLRVEPWRNGSRVTYRNQFVPHGANELAEPLRPDPLERMGDDVASCLGERLHAL